MTTVLWSKFLGLYLDTEEESVLRETEEKIKTAGYVRLMRHEIRRDGLNTEAGRRQIAYCGAMLAELLPRVDTLLF